MIYRENKTVGRKTNHLSKVGQGGAKTNKPVKSACGVFPLAKPVSWSGTHTVTVGTSMAEFVPFIGGTVKEILLGGEVVGSGTLLRFYVLHVAVLPALLVFVLMMHLWRWRKDSMFDQEMEDADE